MADNRGVADQHVETLIAFVQRGGEPVDAGVIAHVERHQRRRTAGRAHRIVDLFERALGPPDRDDVGAGLRQQ